jgi:hypothetical protein
MKSILPRYSAVSRPPGTRARRKPVPRLAKLQFDALVSELERLQVQLAACGVAALGGTKHPAKKHSYGWSPAYQDTLELRRKYDALNLLYSLRRPTRKRAPGLQEGAR